jgi:hypothetical protein
MVSTFDARSWTQSLNEDSTLKMFSRLLQEDLDEATWQDIVEAKPAAKTSFVELVWRERIPLGMNLLLNDESGQLKVVDFPRGSQARTVCEKRNLDPGGFKGATIVAVNGVRHQNDDDLFDALRDPSRPKTVAFELAETEDAERIRKFVEESVETENPKNPQEKETKDRIFETRRVEFLEDGELGIEFANSPDNYGLVVTKFLESDGGVVLAAERNDDVHEGNLLTHVNGKLVLGADGSGRKQALKLLEAEGSKRPLSLKFVDPYLVRAVYEKSGGLPTNIGGPAELEMEEKKLPPADTKRVVVIGFKEVDGVAEKSGVLLGDYLVFINGIAVGAGCRWMGETSGHSMGEVHEMLQDKSNFPIGLTFARPQQQNEESRGFFGATPKTEEIAMESSVTICVTAESYEQLGLVLDMKGFCDIIVKDLKAVPGPFQTVTSTFKDAQTNQLHLSIESVNGEFVPSFANASMVKSAMDRSWKTENRVEILLCDDERKRWTQSLKDEQ